MPAIRDVVRQAFASHEGVESVVDALRASDAWRDLSYVAVVDEDVLGHVCFSRSLLDAPQRLVDVLVLGPMSVTPRMQGRGVGSGLIRYALAQLRNRPEPLVFLEGDPSFYARFGFRPGAQLGFRRPSRRIPKPAFQVLRLPAYDERLTGTLVYHRIWWDHDAVGLRDG